MGKTNSIYFDCKMGVSGDMVLAALLDLGVSVETLKKGLLKLNLGDFDIEIMEEERYGIKGTNVYVKEFEPYHEHNHENHYCSELHDGTGFIECSHGIIPIPVPAVTELLKNSCFKFVQEKENTEMVTPSGLGILKGLGAVYIEKIPGNPLKAGFGFGKKDRNRLSVVTAYLLDKS